MHALVSALVPIIIIVVVAVIIILATERFSPDPFITSIFAVVLIALLLKLVPLLGV